jgi:hypothetical protein
VNRTRYQFVARTRFSQYQYGRIRRTDQLALFEHQFQCRLFPTICELPTLTGPLCTAGHCQCRRIDLPDEALSRRTSDYFKMQIVVFH